MHKVNLTRTIRAPGPRSVFRELEGFCRYSHFLWRRYCAIPINPVVRPAMEQTPARMFKGKVDSIIFKTIKKGRTTPRISRPKAIFSSLAGFSISSFYL